MRALTYEPLWKKPASGLPAALGVEARCLNNLSSDKASFVTGSYYAVDGGYLAH